MSDSHPLCACLCLLALWLRVAGLVAGVFTAFFTVWGLSHPPSIPLALRPGGVFAGQLQSTAICWPRFVQGSVLNPSFTVVVHACVFVAVGVLWGGAVWCVRETDILGVCAHRHPKLSTELWEQSNTLQGISVMLDSV